MESRSSAFPSFLVLLCLSALLWACGNKTAPAGDDFSLTATDTPTRTVKYELHEDGVNSVVTAEAPGDCPWSRAVGEWLDEALGGYYDGDPRDMQALVDTYGKAWADTLRAAVEEFEPEMEVEYEATATKTYETDRIVTYTLEKYIGLGGAHPVSFSEGATFRKSDGRRLGWDIFRRAMSWELNEMIKKSLMAYFGTEDEEELTNLTEIENIYSIPLPKTPPFVLDNGLVFIYQQYEIAAYAYGMPNDTIAFGQIMPMLTHSTQQLIQ